MKTLLLLLSLSLVVGVGLSAITHSSESNARENSVRQDVQVVAKGRGFVHDGRAIAEVTVVGVPGERRTPMIAVQLSIAKEDGTVKKITKRYEGRSVPEETNFLNKSFSSHGYVVSVTCPGRGWRHLAMDPLLYAADFEPGKVVPLPLRVVLSTTD